MADKILVNADSIRQWLLDQGYEKEKIVVIKNGIDLSLYARRKPDDTVRRELDIPDSVPIVTMIARLNPQKGFDEFIKAAALIHRTHPDIYFLIIGGKLEYTGGKFSFDNQYQSELQQLARELGVADRVVFAGHREDIPQILAQSAVSVLPSHSEGLSNSLLESMAAGVPTVATDAGGNSELVEDNVSGILVPIKSPEHIANACKRILDDPRLAHRFGQRARAMAEEKFSLAKMEAETRALYLAELHRAKRGSVLQKQAFFRRPFFGSDK